jgi:hypothetical protein
MTMRESERASAFPVGSRVGIAAAPMAEDEDGAGA